VHHTNTVDLFNTGYDEFQAIMALIQGNKPVAHSTIASFCDMRDQTSGYTVLHQA
jgi:hypothetical protein